MEMGKWTHWTSSPLDVSEYGDRFTSLLNRTRRQNVLTVGSRCLTAHIGWAGLNEGPIAFVGGNGSLAFFDPADMSIAGMRIGVTAVIDGREVRIWRPSFGVRMRGRHLRVDDRSATWLVVPESRRKYRITDETGSDILRVAQTKVTIEESLPSDKLCLLALVHVSRIVMTSSLLWGSARTL